MRLSINIGVIIQERVKQDTSVIIMRRELVESGVLKSVDGDREPLEGSLLESMPLNGGQLNVTSRCSSCHSG